MLKKKIEVEVTYLYTILVDEEDPIVKDYDSEDELIEDLASYRFSVLPVLDEGVRILDTEVLDWSHKTV